MKATQNWTTARVHALRDITPTVREFTLRPEGGVVPHAPGSHLQVQIHVGQGADGKSTEGSGGRLHTRSYSLIGAAEVAPEFYRIAVKRLDAGRGGSRAMWRLAVGDSLRVTEPQNHFALDLAAPAYLLLAGGIGVTPLLGMAQGLAGRRAKLRMVLGARSEAELAYAEPLRQALGAALATAVAERGEMIDFASEIKVLPAGAQVYVCGPAPMLEAVRRAWVAAARPMADLRYETFGNSGRFAPQAFRVKVPRHGLDIIVDSDTGLLDALEQNGIQTLSDCRRGECGLCAMDVLQFTGDIDHRDVFLTDEEKAGNKRICVCVSRVVGDITLDSAYRND